MAMLQGLIQKLHGEDEPKPYGMPGTLQNPNTGITGGMTAPPMAPSGGGDRGYEMPGTGSSGGVGDAGRMLAESTARNNSLIDLGNRRSKLELFDRSGHEGLDREESQIFGGAPRSSYVDPAPSGAGGLLPTADRSKWDTDGFATPGYTAAKAGGVLAGFDPTKWDDANHQTPKYVIGRILQEASGGTGALKDPAQRQQAVGNILKAYPGAKFDGKDKITMPDGGVIDIFGGAGSGDYTASFQLQEGTGRDPQGNRLPTGGGRGTTMAGGGMPLAGMLQGDPSANIGAALGQVGGGDGSLIQRLIAQLQQGAQ